MASRRIRTKRFVRAFYVDRYWKDRRRLAARARGTFPREAGIPYRVAARLKRTFIYRARLSTPRPMPRKPTTADALNAELAKHFKQATINAVTGFLVPSLNLLPTEDGIRQDAANGNVMCQQVLAAWELMDEGLRE